MAFTDAGAGNLALHVGDDPVAVRRRRAELEAAAGLGGRSFRYMNQVHGNDVATIVGSPAANSAGEGPAAPTADAMVSLTEPLAVLVADCVPVVLVGEDPAGAPVLGVVHAGRPGVAAGVVPAAVARLRELGADHISASTGTPGLDLPAGVRSQLEAAGVAIEYSGGCTLEDDTLFSYRRNSHTGRFAGLAWSDGTHGTDGKREHGHD